MIGIVKLILLLVIVSICVSQDEESKIGSIFYNGRYMELDCRGETIDEIYFPPFRRTVECNSISFINCVPSSILFAPVLEKMNIGLPSIKQLVLEYVFNSTALPLNELSFKGLSIRELIISNDAKKPRFRPNDLNFLEPIKQLKELYLSRFELPPLPEDSEITFVTLQNGKVINDFGGCKALQQLEIMKYDVQLVPENWLRNCSQMQTLKLVKSKNLSLDIFRNLITGLHSLQELIIHAPSHLDQFPANLINNLSNLQRIVYYNDKTKKMSLDEIKIDSLKYLDLRHSSLEELQGTPLTSAPYLKLTLSKYPLKRWQFEKLDYEISRKLYLDVSDGNLTLDCDCQHPWLVRAIQEKSLYLNDTSARCIDGTELENVSRDIVECDRFQCGDCTCRRQWSNNATVANCTVSATRVPHVDGLVALHAADNHINVINIEDLPDTLLFLDLRGNGLSVMDANATEILFSEKKRRMLLTGNPIACHCSNIAFIEALQAHSWQVEDYDKVWCNEGNDRRLIREVVPSTLCNVEQRLVQQVQLSISLATLFAIATLISITTIVYLRFKQHIKIYLHARGYTAWCLGEDFEDSDRIYDAFVSFTHADETIVLNEILPQLDNEYKLCLHYRDWVVGNFIPAQITKSVEESCRTIILLSKNFLQSPWGMLEFQTAYSASLENGRARIILVVLDEVLNDADLHPDIRSYIRTNTYLRWGDQWFWDKLRYAMPRISRFAN